MIFESHFNMIRICCDILLKFSYAGVHKCEDQKSEITCNVITRVRLIFKFMYDFYFISFIYFSKII